MKKLLIITTNFPPSTSIGTQRILKILKFIDKEKWKPYVLTLQERYFGPAEAIDDPYAKNIIDKVAVTRTRKLDVNQKLLDFRNRLKGFWGKKGRSPSKSASDNGIRDNGNPKKKTFFQQMASLLEFPDQDIDWLPIAVCRGCQLIRKHQIDVIFSSSPRHSNHLTSTFLKILTRKKLVIEFRDPWARVPWVEDVRGENGFARLKHKIIQVLEAVVVKKADNVVFVTQEMKDDFKKYYPKLSSKFKVVYNGYDSDLRSCGSLNQSLDIKNTSYVFSHIGSLYQKRNPEPLLQAIKKMCSNEFGKSVSFQFVGNLGPDLKYIHSLVDDLQISSCVSFSDSVSYQESLSIMSRSDVLVVLQPGTTLQIPGKIFDYLNIGKPVLGIGEPKSALESMIKTHRIGLFADVNDTKDIQDKIEDIIKNYDDVKISMKSSKCQFKFEKRIKELEHVLMN